MGHALMSPIEALAPCERDNDVLNVIRCAFFVQIGTVTYLWSHIAVLKFDNLPKCLCLDEEEWRVRKELFIGF